MELYLAAPYIISGSICLVIGIILLMAKPFKELGKGSPYRTIKALIACGAFLDVIIDIAVIILICNHIDIYILDYFFVPIICLLQLTMMTYAILGLIHSKIITKRLRLITQIAIVSLIVLYIASYNFYACTAHNGSLSIATYRFFINTIYASIIQYITYSLTVISIIASIILLYKEIQKYDKNLESLHSGRNVTEGRKFEFMGYAFLLYFILAAVDFLWPNDIANFVIIMFNTAMFVAFTIVIMDLQIVFYTVKSANTSYESDHDDPILNNTKEIPSIKDKIERWKSDPRKEWLTEGITLTQVADSMKIKPRLLSGFLNDILNINFSKWISTLRVEEVEKMMRDNPTMPLGEIAIATGFSDTSTLSRIFKQIVGKSPSEYRKQLLTND